MKKHIKQFIRFIKQYLPDIIILTGIWTLSYNILIPNKTVGGIPSISLSYTNYHTNEKMFGIMLIAIGLDIAFRRYIKNKK